MCDHTLGPIMLARLWTSNPQLMISLFVPPMPQAQTPRKRACHTCVRDETWPGCADHDDQCDAGGLEAMLRAEPRLYFDHVQEVRRSVGLQHRAQGWRPRFQHRHGAAAPDAYEHEFVAGLDC